MRLHVNISCVQLKIMFVISALVYLKLVCLDVGPGSVELISLALSFWNPSTVVFEQSLNSHSL